LPVSVLLLPYYIFRLLIFVKIDMKKHLPNLITLINLLAGCMAIVFLFKDAYLLVLVCLLVSSVADLADGLVARLLNVDSPLGKQLDSLADAVSFGVVPALMMYQVLNHIFIDQASALYAYLPYFALIIAAASVMRLGIFNIDTRQSTYFIGLPTPANTIFFLGIYLNFYTEQKSLPFLQNPWLILVLITLFSYLMLSELQLIKASLPSKKNPDSLPLVLLAISAIPLYIFFGYASISFLILLYIGLSLSFKRTKPHVN
jgi:CDP-diacylglycerol---serine O-phosphatidyltransferase